MPVNGKRYDWESITITAPSGVMVDIQSIEYSDKREVTPVHGKGSKPRGYGEGNYEAEGKMTVLKEEFGTLLLVLAALGGGKLYAHKPFPIAVTYNNADQPVPQADVLRGVKLTDLGDARKQADTKSEVEIGFKITGGILRNGVEPV
jgi:hypothetical protein